MEKTILHLAIFRLKREIQHNMDIYRGNRGSKTGHETTVEIPRRD